jgi:N-acylneuraminate cytidylyltransferase/CMP-N,N'-diacetyllegionaminic acid synthase
MIGSSPVIALVPARRGSKGLPLKNVRLLLGKPLLSYPIATALGSRYVDRVIVSTDDAEFAEVARTAGADVPFLRPAELATDTAPSIGFILHALDWVASSGAHYEYLVLLEPTSPLTEPQDVDAALEALAERKQDADAVVSVTRLVSTHPDFVVRIDAGGLLRPNHAPSFGLLPRRQDIEPRYALDGSLYISSVESLRRNRSFCHERTLPYITPRFKSFEIDDLLDFFCIEAILAHREELRAAEDPGTPDVDEHSRSFS